MREGKSPQANESTDSRDQPAGILNLNKPGGPTSRRVVDQVQRLAGRIKVGHAGTLDPLATGVLLVTVGPATRLVEYLHRLAKRYRGRFLLGVRSATDDLGSTPEPVARAAAPSRAAVDAALSGFTGTIQQRPPAYSAAHVEGDRAYKRARAGKAVTPPPKPVVIHALEVISYAYPRLEVDVVCGSGTYIRSLARDVGERLACGGLLEELTRTAIGPFSLADAVDPGSLTAENWPRHLRPAVEALPDLRRVALSWPALHRLMQGQGVEWTSAAAQLEHVQPQPSAGDSRSASAAAERMPPNDNEELAVLDPAGELAAIAVYQARRGLLQPHRVLMR